MINVSRFSYLRCNLQGQHGGTVVSALAFGEKNQQFNPRSICMEFACSCMSASDLGWVRTPEQTDRLHV